MVVARNWLIYQHFEYTIANSIEAVYDIWYLFHSRPQILSILFSNLVCCQFLLFPLLRRTSYSERSDLGVGVVLVGRGESWMVPGSIFIIYFIFKNVFEEWEQLSVFAQKCCTEDYISKSHAVLNGSSAGFLSSLCLTLLAFISVPTSWGCNWCHCAND